MGEAFLKGSVAGGLSAAGSAVAAANGGGLAAQALAQAGAAAATYAVNSGIHEAFHRGEAPASFNGWSLLTATAGAGATPVLGGFFSRLAQEALNPQTGWVWHPNARSWDAFYQELAMGLGQVVIQDSFGSPRHDSPKPEQGSQPVEPLPAERIEEFDKIDRQQMEREDAAAQFARDSQIEAYNEENRQRQLLLDAMNAGLEQAYGRPLGEGSDDRAIIRLVLRQMNAERAQAAQLAQTQAAQLAQWERDLRQKNAEINKQAAVLILSAMNQVGAEIKERAKLADVTAARDQTRTSLGQARVEAYDRGIDATVAIARNMRAEYEAKEAFTQAWLHATRDPGSALFDGSVAATTKYATNLKDAFSGGSGRVAKELAAETLLSWQEFTGESVLLLADVGPLVSAIGQGLRAPAELRAALRVGEDASYYAVRVQGAVTRNAGKADTRLFKSSRQIMKEKVVVETDSGRVITRTGEKTKVKLPPVSGEAIKSTTHTHPVSQIALPSIGDIEMFAQVPGKHSILGDKWPMARRVAAQLGITEVPREVVKTTMTQAEAAAALALIETGQTIGANAMDVLVDVTSHIAGKAP